MCDHFVYGINGRCDKIICVFLDKWTSFFDLCGQMRPRVFFPTLYVAFE